MKPRELIDAARREVEDLTGKHVDAVTGFEHDGDGWRVSLEVVEVERVPPTTSVLATYEAVVDERGTLRDYARTSRYYRNQVDRGD